MIADAQAIWREAQSVGIVAYLPRQVSQVEYGNQNWTTIVQVMSANF
jgi:hypothetical protein